MDKPIKIHENAHAKLMKDMSNYLDICKTNKQTCQCSAILEYYPKETNEFKKWAFHYQCNDTKKGNDVVKNVTLNLLKNVDIKKEIYSVDK